MHMLFTFCLQHKRVTLFLGPIYSCGCATSTCLYVFVPHAVSVNEPSWFSLLGTQIFLLSSRLRFDEFRIIYFFICCIFWNRLLSNSSRLPNMLQNFLQILIAAFTFIPLPLRAGAQTRASPGNQ